MSTVTIGLATIASVALWAVMVYNTLVKMRNQVDECWSGIDVQLKRRYYNGTARVFNTKIETFPDMVVANSFGFHKREYFEISDPAEKAVPQVKF